MFSQPIGNHGVNGVNLFMGSDFTFDPFFKVKSWKVILNGLYLAYLYTIAYCRFCFATSPPQCVERFHHYRSNEKIIIASLLIFPGYIHNHKILPGNIFGLILKNKMAATSVSLSVMKRAYISLIIDPRVLGW